MQNNIYTRQEIMNKTGVTPEQLKAWQSFKLLQPVGYTDDKQPVYSHRLLEQIEKIKGLLDMGYELSDIQKIIRKIGLPQAEQKPAVPADASFLTVGTLAQRVDASPRTLKYWETIGIIEPDMRSEGGFRLYSEHWVYLCQLIKDLQLFGYSLEEIKEISDYFREFIRMQGHLEAISKSTAAAQIQAWQHEIDALFEKIEQYKQGIQRWEELLKRKRKEINQLQSQNQKRPDSKGASHE